MVFGSEYVDIVEEAIMTAEQYLRFTVSLIIKPLATKFCVK